MEILGELILGIPSRESDDIKIQPNPATTLLVINGLEENGHYRIYNTLGTEISTGTLSATKEIAIESYSPGLYLLKFGNNKAIKFIKE